MAGALDAYRAKRRFDETPEPSGEGLAEAGWRYAIQKHDATRLHYDLRLELDGVLLSWAITRGPSLDPQNKRLAVRTEDHPVDYAGFEGVIPSGYGAGTVMLWDRGAWEPIGDPHDELKKGKIAFHLYGERLKGRWALVRMKPRPGEKRENWLLIKEKDDEVSRTKDVLTAHVRSVTSERTMAEIAKGAPSGAKASPKPKRSKPVAAPEPPAFVEPQLATLAEEIPAGDDWLFEIKFDGYRAQIAASGDRVSLYTRSGLDWTERFPAVAAAARKLKLDRCLIDGEIVALDDDGRSDFGALQAALEEGRSRELTCFAFDMLVDGGEDLRKLPLTERKARLKLRLAPAGSRGPIFYTDDFDDGAAGLEALSAKGFEGVIAKKRTAPYRSGRAKSWLKIKTGHVQEFVVVGFSPSENGRRFASLLVATQQDGRLIYAGRVGTGFSDGVLDRLGEALAVRARKTSTLEAVPPGPIGRKAQWVTPDLVAQVAFAGFTRDGQIRHGRYLGLREDKPAGEVVRETPVAPRRKTKRESSPLPVKSDVSDFTTPSILNSGTPELRGERSIGASLAGEGASRSASAAPPHPALRADLSPPGRGEGRGRSDQIGKASANVRLTHPERELYPGVTKRDVADYLATVGPKMLPLVTRRALSLVRCPEGIDGERFFQKHAHSGLPDAVGRETVTDADGKADEKLVLDRVEAIVSTAQVSALELHVSGARLDRFENPDRLVFDLDPDEAVGFATVKDAAFGLRDALDALGLTSFALLTGGKGVHVVVPLDRRRAWPDVSAFARALAERFASHDPKSFVATMSKAKRRGKIFIDHFRNAPSATAIAPYSLRARAGAPVAAPVTWDELSEVDRADAFTIADAGRLADADPWAGYAKVRQTLSAQALRALNIET